jgi:hypothetical protein
MGRGGVYIAVVTSEPAKAKSQSCLLHLEGRPEKQPVRYSTQFGPPAEVPICNCMSVEAFEGRRRNF